ncbi:MAG TPA: hypothetical protein VFR07_15055 [Mycobacteriales bacterium]|nr:hypothetical protein [Mycobacteriales bacterium]
MTPARQQPGLIRTAAALRLALLRGSLRDGPGAAGRRLGLLLGGLVGVVLALVAFLLLAGLRGDGSQGQDLATVLFTGLLLGWVVLPVLTFGSDDLLDPTRLALLPLTRRRLLVVMGVGALIGVAPLATATAGLGLLPATATGPTSAAVGLLAVVLLLALCVTASRATAAALSGVLRSRRGRDLGVVLAAVVALGFQLLNPLVQLSLRRGAGAGAEGPLHTLAQALRWSPTGLLAAAPGRPLPSALLSLAAVAALVVLVLLVWERSVRRALERPDSSRTRRRPGTALAPRLVPLPGGRVGALAAKDLRYLTREPRRMVALLTQVLVPVLAVGLGPLALRDGPPPDGLVFLVCGAALLASLGSANRFGTDGSASWLLIATATSPRDARRDLLGGDVAVAVVTVPVLLALAAALGALTGGWSYVPAALGTALALLAVGIGLSGLLAVSAPYAVPPSQNAFSTGGAGQGCAASALTVLALGGAIVGCLPLLALLLPALGSTTWSVVLLVVGPTYGLGVGALLRAHAARRWTARSPEVLQVLVAGRT